MTKQETIKIMAMLSALYAGGKNEPEQQAAIWHMIIGEYDYETAKEAVLRYAKNDVRDYATFPACGVIVAGIKQVETEREAPIKEILHHIQTGLDYYTLSTSATALISEGQFREWSNIDAEVFASKADEYAEILRSRRDNGYNAFDVTGNVLKRLSNGNQQ